MDEARPNLNIHLVKKKNEWSVNRLFFWCLTHHRQRGHLETAPPFTVPCIGREARFSHRSHRGSNPGPSFGSPLHYRCAMPAPLNRLLYT